MVLHYIKATPGQGIIFSHNSTIQLKLILDSNWASCLKRRRSIINFYIFLGDSQISWKAKKQAVISYSFIDAKYRALATTIIELS